MALPPKQQATRTASLEALGAMRGNKRQSLSRAARDAGVSPQAVKHWAKSALRRGANGRWTAKPSDRLLRLLRLPAKGGTRDIAVRGSRLGSQVGQYASAVQHYLATGDPSRLKPFKGKSIRDASRAAIPLLTELDLLDELGSAGVVSFESLYAEVG